MKSTSDLYISNLDHLRALAAFMVFTWHFVHHDPGCNELCYVEHHFAAHPWLSILQQGHTGVALFMCISGYIFIRLVDGKKVHIGKFWYNRVLRLFPLLLAWGLVGIAMLASSHLPDMHAADYVHALFHPPGSWTVYLELRYYAVFPVLLFCVRKWRPLPVIALALAGTIGYRYMEWHLHGTVQEIAYNKLAGRGDQFLIGSAAFYVEQWLLARFARPKPVFYAIGTFALIMLLVLFQRFNAHGGYYNYGGYPSPSALWILLPTLEALCYCSILIAYLQIRVPALPDKILSSMGKWSYSIYLNHFIMVPIMFLWISTHWGMPEDFLGRLLVGTCVVFPIIVLVSALTYHAIEKPFLRLRKPYLAPTA